MGLPGSPDSTSSLESNTEEGRKKKKKSSSSSSGPKAPKKKGEGGGGGGGKVVITRMSRNKRKSVTVVTGLDAYPGAGRGGAGRQVEWGLGRGPTAEAKASVDAGFWMKGARL